MNSEQIIQEATEAVEKGLPCAYLVPHLLEVAKNQKLEIEILIRKKEALRDEIAEQQAEIERLKNAYKQCAWERDVFSEDINAIKSEAYREFADKLHDNFISKVQKHYCRLNTEHSYKYTEGYTADDVLSTIVNTLEELARNLHGKQ